MTNTLTNAGRRGLRAGLAALAACSSAVSAQAPEVGRVSLHIGQAWVVRADGVREPLARGAAIHVGDRVETAANGHVHMRFVDNAAVSVRPDSTFLVQAYRYDARQPQASEIRLLVEKGSSRSISGAATESDKSRFRLNTPIAAIGIRGTDFIVQTGPAGDKASVAHGAIIMSPLGGSCTASGLGPCAGIDVRELSAEMGRLMAVLRPGEAAARLVPGESPQMLAATSADRRQAGIDRSLAIARASGLLAAEPSEAEARRGSDASAAGILTFATAETHLNRPSNLSGQLVWGRWAIQSDERDRFSVPFSLASLGRHVTVADAETGLFRSNQSAAGELFPSTLQGTVDFRLSRATAVFESAERSETAAVGRSSLTIDFSRRTFATGLDLKSVSGVSGELRVAGDIRSDGLFVLREGAIDQRAEQRVAGAISLNGREAAYLFERSADGGWFRGRTLWGP